MRISEALGLKGRETISFIGGGGKTSLMFRLAEEIPFQNTVIITTTTKIYLPPERFPLVILGEEEQAERELYRYLQAGLRPVVAAGLLENNKLGGISPGQVSLLQQYADYVLVEADGSRGLSLKGHLESEPVIPGTATLIVVVVGADILGKTLEGRYVHRPEVVSKLTGREIGTAIDAEFVAELIAHPEGLLRECPQNARVVLFINKTELLSELDEALRLGRLALGKKIEKVILGSATGKEPVLTVLQ